MYVVADADNYSVNVWRKSHAKYRRSCAHNLEYVFQTKGNKSLQNKAIAKP